MNIAEELQKLEELHQSGALNDQEFASAKATLLTGPAEGLSASAVPGGAPGAGTLAQERETRLWAMLLHLTILAGYVVPILGLIVPIGIWQWKKPTLPGIDEHGKNAVNFIISLVMYTVVSLLLVFVLIGIPMLMALGVVAVVFPIIAAIKANNGEVWKYPLTLRLVK